MEAPIAAEETILDSDAYIHIVTHLTGDVRDVCNFAQACRYFRTIALSDDVWDAACNAWAKRHVLSSRGFDAAAAQKAFRLSSRRALAQALHLLRGDPIGLWAECPEPGVPAAFGPRGRLLRSRVWGGKVVLESLSADLSFLEYQVTPTLLEPADQFPEIMASLQFLEHPGNPARTEAPAAAPATAPAAASSLSPPPQSCVELRWEAGTPRLWAALLGSPPGEVRRVSVQGFFCEGSGSGSGSGGSGSGSGSGESTLGLIATAGGPDDDDDDDAEASAPSAASSPSSRPAGLIARLSRLLGSARAAAASAAAAAASRAAAAAAAALPLSEAAAAEAAEGRAGPLRVCAITLARIDGLDPGGDPFADAAAGVNPVPLERYSGLYTAPYGPHGLEIVQFRLTGGGGGPSSSSFSSAAAGDAPASASASASAGGGPAAAAGAAAGDAAAAGGSRAAASASAHLQREPSAHARRMALSPQCPLADQPVRIEGFKITGDRNVPSGRHTFVASPAHPVPGPLSDDPREVVWFQRVNVVLVDLEERAVQRRLRCCGQINRVPGVWDPQWVDAELLLYEPGKVVVLGAPVLFSVLWNDRDVSFRHIIDYTPLAPSLRAPPAWPQPPAPGAASASADDISMMNGGDGDDDGVGGESSER